MFTPVQKHTMSSDDSGSPIKSHGVSQSRPDSSWYDEDNHTEFTYKAMAKGFGVSMKQLTTAEEFMLSCLSPMEIYNLKFSDLILEKIVPTGRLASILTEMYKNFNWMQKTTIQFNDGTSVQIPHDWKVNMWASWLCHASYNSTDRVISPPKMGRLDGLRTNEKADNASVSKRWSLPAAFSTPVSQNKARVTDELSFHPLHACYLVVTDVHDASRTTKVAVALLTKKWTDDGLDIDVSGVSFDTLLQCLVSSVAFDRDRELLQFSKQGSQGRCLLSRLIRCDDDLRDAITILLEKGSMEIPIMLVRTSPMIEY